MSEDPRPAARPRPSLLSWALWGAALVGVAAVLYIIVQSSSKPEAPKVATVPVAEAPPLKPLAEKLARPGKPTPPPDYAFFDEAGKPVKLADFKGKVVVANVWATWCAPCKNEMPTLAKAAAAYKGQPVAFVVVSIDKPEAAAQARLFIAQNDPLKFYNDPEAKLIFKLDPPAQGAPTTLIYGKDGLERVRVNGEADWTSPEARALIDDALKG
jgi:thiol-disulfide isomerase/thioredoxin